MIKWIDKKPEIRKFEIWEASWLAGVIDGEGSIGLYDYGKEGRRVCIQASNTNRAFMEKMRRIIGAGSSVMRTDFSNSHKGRKPLYHYTLKGSARCYIILKQILPYLIIKREKTYKIIREIENNPFGRWKNCTKESRIKHSKLMKKNWQDPKIREKITEGIRKHFNEVKMKKALITGV